MWSPKPLSLKGQQGRGQPGALALHTAHPTVEVCSTPQAENFSWVKMAAVRLAITTTSQAPGRKRDKGTNGAKAMPNLPILGGNYFIHLTG